MTTNAFGTKIKFAATTSAARRYNSTIAQIVATHGSSFTLQPKPVPTPLPRSTVFRVRARRTAGTGTIYKAAKLAGPIGKLP